MKRSRLKFLNVVDDRGPSGHSTIMYTDGPRPTEDGFTYSFKYGTGKGYVVYGAGDVVSERYSKMSPEEIELTCSVEAPTSPDDIYMACVRGGMTSAYAKKHAGLGGKKHVR